MTTLINLQFMRGREYNIKHHSQKLSHSKRTEEIRYGLLCSPSVRDVARNIPSQIRNHPSVQEHLGISEPKVES